MKTTEQIAQLKQTENMTRFEIRCIFEQIVPTEEMLLKVRRTCREWYEANPGKHDFPSQALINIARGLEAFPVVESKDEADSEWPCAESQELKTDILEERSPVRDPPEGL